MKTSKRIYVNPVQARFLKAFKNHSHGKRRIKVLIAGRALGKSSVIALRTRENLAALPRAKFFFSSTTYAQILTKTLPAIKHIWKMYGLKEHTRTSNGHYVIGKRPPEHWDTPYSPPEAYKNVITWFNGYTIEMLSMDRPDLARGGSYDGGDIDEAALVKKEHINTVILPSMRGNLHRYNSPLHYQLGLYSSMPWKTSGQYLLEYEDKAKADPDRYFYIEGTAMDNIQVLGQDFIDFLKQEMSPLEFAVEVMNQRITKVEDQFYTSFDEDVHPYSPKATYGEGPGGITFEGYKDHNPNQLIEVSMDFDGWFNGMICFQESKNEEKAFDSFFVINERKINELIDDFCQEYQHKQIFKYVRVWGDPRGHDRRPDGPTLYEQIYARFNKNGWGCEIKAKSGRTTNHISRHYFMNELLSGENQRLPKFKINQERCKDVIIALQLTQIKPDFKKNKSKEKDKSFPQEHAPHFTDMLDYYLYEKHAYKSKMQGLGTSVMPGTVIFH